MLANATILLVRHGEKDHPCEKDDTKKESVHLNARGKARAQKYVQYFGSYVPRERSDVRSPAIELTHLFAAADSDDSHRSRETLEPFAAANPALPFDHSIADKEWCTLVEELRTADYESAAVLVCWHHGEIVGLANALLGDLRPPPPPQSCWPPPNGEWNCKAFGWVMQIRYDANGVAETDWVAVIDEKLMPDDAIPPPPTPKWPIKPQA